MARINLEQQKEGCRIDGNVPEHVDRNIILILDFYEFLCQGASEGSLSRNAIKSVRGGAMRTTYKTCNKYIEDRRNALDRPGLYRAYERFVIKVVGDADV